ncbi:glycoside hydrolase family 65 protein, partial [Vibrio paracholerae]|nr:glycoside hydrolase family 65 protein [Vibrio paracholerae]
FVFLTSHRYLVDGQETEIAPSLAMDRRKVWVNINYDLKAGETFSTEKVGVVHTSRDKQFDVEGYELQALRDHALTNLKNNADRSFDELLEESAAEWDKRWAGMNITIGGSDFDQLAIRFAQYQLNIFTPMHDSRFGIGAKGLSGEGYKGHSFWDTEVFMLP